MSKWSSDADIRDDKYNDIAKNKNTKLTMEVMAQTPKGKSLIEKAMKKLEEIGKTEI